MSLIERQGFYMALIYVVEDDQNIREIESFSLKNSGYEVVDFEYGNDFLKALKEQLPDLIVLDVMLPDSDGLQIIAKLRANKQTERIPIILVTAKTTELDKVKGLDVGADDYLTKPFGVMELISRVKALLRRTAGTDQKRTLVAGDVLLDDEKHTVLVKGKNCELTFKEYELLKLLMNKKGSVTTREEILNLVWGTDFEGESRTLDMHIKTLRQKLAEAGEVIRTVRNVGYIMDK